MDRHLLAQAARGSWRNSDSLLWLAGAACSVGCHAVDVTLDMVLGADEAFQIPFSLFLAWRHVVGPRLQEGRPMTWSP